MASILLLLSELLGGESAAVLAAERYMGGHRSQLGDFRPAVTAEEAPAAPKRKQQGQRQEQERDDKKKRDEYSFADLAVSRIAVEDIIMWP